MSSKYAKIKRHELKRLVEEEYGITIQNMHEGDRGILVHIDTGVKILKRTKTDDPNVLFAGSACRYLADKGFTNIGCINKTLSGDYTINYNDTLYFLQDFTKGRRMNIASPKDAAEAARALAELHKAAKGFIPTPGSRARVDWGRWMEKCKSYHTNMKKYKEAAEKKDTKSRFDKTFLKYADMYCERMERAYMLFKEGNYLEKVQQAMQCNQLIHREFRKHALYRQENGELFITNMDGCSYDIIENDLADLIEGFSGADKTQMAAEALRAYADVTPLDPKSIKLIRAFLIQPKGFYRIIDKYYGKKKDYTENVLTYKLEKYARKENAKDDIIAFLETYEP